ncbi:MAG: hypothetical protein ACTSUE_09600 [Promethearchaeota archaeon]
MDLEGDVLMDTNEEEGTDYYECMNMNVHFEFGSENEVQRFPKIPQFSRFQKLRDISLVKEEEEEVEEDRRLRLEKERERKAHNSAMCRTRERILKLIDRLDENHDIVLFMVTPGGVIRGRVSPQYRESLQPNILKLCETTQKVSRIKKKRERKRRRRRNE